MKLKFPNFKLSDYITPNILSALGWVMIVTTFCLLISKYGIILAEPLQDFWFYAGFYYYNAVFVIVLTTIVFPIELLFSYICKKKILAINIKNIPLKFTYQLLFYVGLIGLYYVYYVLWETFIRWIN